MILFYCFETSYITSLIFEIVCLMVDKILQNRYRGFEYQRVYIERYFR